MYGRIIKSVITLTVIAGLTVPAPVLAAVNADPLSAAADGIRYLNANQGTDGGISGGIGGETEWTAVAVQAAGKQASTFTHGGSSLLDFLKDGTADMDTPALAIEREIIAIAAAGQDPSDFGEIDYMALLSAKHKGGQIGDNVPSVLLNDDMFGIIAIDATHDTGLLPEAQNALDYLLAHQGADGGFSNTTDCSVWCGEDSNDTAAALIALYAASDLGLSPSDTTINLDLRKGEALNYLLTTRQTDGGFSSDPSSPSDGSSTAWALMALNLVGSSVETSAASARNWLMNDQNADGGFSFGAYGITNSDTYTTSSAVLALLGTTWLLNPAPTPIVVQAPQPPSSGGSGGTSTQTGASGSGSDTNDNRTAGTTSGSGTAVTQTASDAGTDGSKTDKTRNDKSDQVKGASITTPTKSGDKKTDKAGNRSALYGAAALILVALIWFMLESRKGQGVKDES
jgi:hypothetical protein